jgi:MFS family permease
LGGYIIPEFGWRTSYFYIALMACTLIPLVLLIIKKSPAVKEHPPKSDESECKCRRSNTAQQEVTFREALLSAPFFFMCGAFMLSQFSCVGTIQNQVPHLQDIGYPMATAAAALGLIGMVSAVSKLIFGWLCDILKPKYAFSISILLMAGSTCVLMSVGPRSSNLYLWLYAVIMGFGAGGWLPTMSMLVSTNFGMGSYGSIFGALTLAHCIGVSAGPLFAGYIHDVTSGYHWAFVTALVLYFLSIPAMLAVNPMKKKGYV